MAHMIGETDNMMYVGEVPWHGLGTYVGDDPVVWAEAIVAAGLDWQVRKLPALSFFNGQLIGEENPEHAEFFNVVRSRMVNGKRVRDILGSGQKGRYEVYQNQELGDFLDNVAGANGPLRYHTAGSLNDGRRIWMLAKYPGATEPVAGDVVHRFLLLSSTHDGTGSVNVRPTTVRVVCNNTLTLALAGRREGLTFKHVGDLNKKVAQARETLGFIEKEISAFDETAKVLAAKPISEARFKEILGMLIPVSEKRPTRALNQHATILQLVEEGKGTQIPGVRGTAWGYLNALTEWTNHHRTYNDTSKQAGGKSAAENRMDSLFFSSQKGSALRIASQAKELLLAE